MRVILVMSLACLGCGDEQSPTPTPECAGLRSALTACAADGRRTLEGFDVDMCNAAEPAAVDAAARCVRRTDCTFLSAQALEACLMGLY